MYKKSGVVAAWPLPPSSLCTTLYIYMQLVPGIPWLHVPPDLFALEFPVVASVLCSSCRFSSAGPSFWLLPGFALNKTLCVSCLVGSCTASVELFVLQEFYLSFAKTLVRWFFIFLSKLEFSWPPVSFPARRVAAPIGFPIEPGPSPRWRTKPQTAR